MERNAVNPFITRMFDEVQTYFRHGDLFGVIATLEEVYEQGGYDILKDLVDVKYAADQWDVSERRARAHIAKLHEEHGIGWQLGGSWVLLKTQVEAHAPQKKYRKDKKINGIEQEGEEWYYSAVQGDGK